jgi:hypothetical protein
MAHRPFPLTVLGALQFVAFAVGCVVLLGDGTLDGELSVADVAAAVAVALLGALVVGSTWSGGRVGWWLELALAVITIAWGAVSGASGDGPGYPLVAAGVVWFGLAVLPQSRAWFLRPLGP